MNDRHVCCILQLILCNVVFRSFCVIAMAYAFSACVYVYSFNILTKCTSYKLKG